MLTELGCVQTIGAGMIYLLLFMDFAELTCIAAWDFSLPFS